MTAAGSSEKVRTVVFHHGALGDFLLAASAINELAGIYAFGHIDFWSKPEHVSLLTGKSYLGECHCSEDPLISRLLQDSLWRTATLPDFLLKADNLFIFGQAGSHLMAERLSARLSARVYRVQSFPAANNARTHVARFLRKQLKDLGWPIGGKPLTLSPHASEKLAARELLRELGIHARPVFIHPGSGGRRKVWPLANWHGLLDWIQRELPFQALLSIGPSDDYMDQFSEALRKAGVPIVSGLPLLRLSALLSLCGLYIGSDSGVSHLAAATGIPAITVFGPTDPRVWAPRGSNAVALRRTWKETDGFTWAPSHIPHFQDKEIADLVKSVLRPTTRFPDQVRDR